MNSYTIVRYSSEGGHYYHVRAKDPNEAVKQNIGVGKGNYVAIFPGWIDALDITKQTWEEIQVTNN